MLQDFEIGKRVGQSVEVRGAALRVRWEFKNLISADGHSLNAVFSSAVRGLPEATERRMFEEAFLSDRAVATAQDVAKYFDAALRSAIETFVAKSPGEGILGDETRADLIALFMKAGAAVAFGCGLEILPPAQVDVDSPSLREARRELLARQNAKRAAEEQADRMERSAQTFKSFQAIRQSAPELSTAQVLARVGIADQSEVIRSLLLASAQEAENKPLWAVAGPYLVRVDFIEERGADAKLIPLPPALGPLRSVGAGLDGALLIGVRGGAMSVDPARPDDAAIYSDPAAQSALGFNAVVARGQEIWATHADAGVVCWDAHDGAEPRVAIRPQESGVSQFSPHHLTVVDGLLLVASGNQLFVIEEGAKLRAIQTGPYGDIQAILLNGDSPLVVYSTGAICAIDLDGKAPCVQRRAGHISAAATMPWVSETRLLLATEDGPVVCAAFDDELITQYSSAYQSLRVVAASAAKIAGVSSDRQRIIFWNSWDGRKPAGEVHVGGLARHRVADIAFV